MEAILDKAGDVLGYLDKADDDSSFWFGILIDPETYEPIAESCHTSRTKATAWIRTQYVARGLGEKQVKSRSKAERPEDLLF